MPTVNDAKLAIYNHFISQWGATTPFGFDNEKITPPSNSPWVRVSVRNRISNQETLGVKTNRKFLREGAIFTQIFVPIQTGTSKADELSQKVVDIFEGENLGQVWLLESDIREVGPDGNYFNVLVETRFNYEETK